MKIFIRYLLSSACMWLVWTGTTAQTLTMERSVIGSAGNILVANQVPQQNKSLGFTIGEAVIETHVQGNETLYQGFWFNSFSLDLTTGLDAILYNHPGISIYPNPTKGELVVEGPSGLMAAARLYDLKGKLVLEAILSGGRVDLGQVSRGMYQLVTLDQKGQPTGSFKVVKW